MTYTLGEVFATINPRLELRGVNDNNGEPIRTVSLEATPTEGYLELPKGDPGAAGDPGPTQPVVKWQGAINTEAALPSGLGGGQAGWAWGNTANGDVFIWLGDTWLRLPHALTVVGPAGASNRLSIGTVTVVDPSQPAAATLTGEPPNQVLNLSIPKGDPGPRGDPGPAGPIAEAADFDATAPLQVGDVLAWNGTKWGPQSFPAIRGPWTLGSGAFAEKNVDTASEVIAQLTIPAQSVDCRPLVFGGVETNPRSTDTRIDTEVRLGSATGVLVGLGPGIPDDMYVTSRILPCLEGTYTPDNAPDVVPAGTQTVLYVVQRRFFGTITWRSTRLRASLVAYLVPVTS